MLKVRSGGTVASSINSDLPCTHTLSNDCLLHAFACCLAFIDVCSLRVDVTVCVCCLLHDV